MRATTRLHELLAGPDLLVAPGAYDALSARLIAQAGFSLIYMTGFGTAGSVLGQPDVGLLTMSEMVDRATALAAAEGRFTSIPGRCRGRRTRRRRVRTYP